MEPEITAIGDELSEVILRWSGTEPQQDLKANEFQEFIDDTDCLVRFFGDNYYNKGFYTRDKRMRPIPTGNVPGAKQLIEYWGQWGPLYTVQENKVSIAEIVNVCWVANALNLCWSAINGNAQAEDFASRFFGIVDTYREVSAHEDELLSKRPYWQGLSLHDEIHFPGEFWAPVEGHRGPTEGIPNLLLFPDPQLDDDDWSAKREYLKNAVLEYIAFYISQLKISFEVTAQGTDVFFVGRIDSAIAAYLMYKFTGMKQQEVRVCACGCQRRVSGRKVYASPECKNRAKNTDPIRVIESWLRTRKSRGQVTTMQYDDLRQEIRSLNDEGWSASDIRTKIENRLGVKR